MGNSCCKKVKTVDEKEVLKQIKESNTIETTKIFEYKFESINYMKSSIEIKQLKINKCEYCIRALEQFQ